MALQGATEVSDQDFVKHQGMPQELTFNPDMNLWMTYHIYLGNKKHETPSEVERLLRTQFISMRLIISPRIWLDMSVQFYTDDGDEWWMSDDHLLEACRQIYEKFSGS